MDASLLEAWVGRRETAVDRVTVPLVNRLAATLDRDDSAPRVVRQSQIGADGHPRRGDAVSLFRRNLSTRTASITIE